MHVSFDGLVGLSCLFSLWLLWPGARAFTREKEEEEGDDRHEGDNSVWLEREEGIGKLNTYIK